MNLLLPMIALCVLEYRIDKIDKNQYIKYFGVGARARGARGGGGVWKKGFVTRGVGGHVGGE